MCYADTKKRKTMEERLLELGETFKQKRKEKNLTLKEAENATSIRATYLQSIENGDLSKLISPIYAEGFIKQYASYLGLDGESIVRENIELFRNAIAQDFAYGIGTLEVRENPGAKVKWLPNLVWVAGFGVLLLFSWWLAKYLEVL